MASIDIKIDGVLADWLEQDGRGELVDAGTVSVDAAELASLEAQCQRQHRDYTPEQRQAWAVVCLVGRKKIPKSEQEQIGGIDATGIARVAQSVELQGKDFRSLRDAFSKQHEAIAGSGLQVAGKIDLLTQTVNGARKSHSVDANQICLHVESFRQTWAQEAHLRREEERARWQATWAWRVAIFILLFLIAGVLISKAAPEPEPDTIIYRAVGGELAAFKVLPSGALAQIDGLPIPLPVQLRAGTTTLTATGTSLNVNCTGGCSGGGGSGGTSSDFAAAFPTSGTAAGASDGTNMQPLLVDPATGNLKVAQQGTVVISFTAPQHAIVDSATLGTVTVTGALTDTQLRATAVPVSVSGVATSAKQDTGNTSLASLVTNFDVALSTRTKPADQQHVLLDANSGVDIGKLTANQSVNLSQINGVTPLMGAGNTGSGSPRVTIASDQTAIPVTGPLTDTQLRASAVPVSGTFFQATQPVSIASGQVASGAFAGGSIADGAEVTIGTKTDAKSTATDGTSTSVVSVLKEISAMVQSPASTPITAASLPLPSGAATSSNQTTEIASLANVDVALSTRTKPADNQNTNLAQIAGYQVQAANLPVVQQGLVYNTALAGPRAPEGYSSNYGQLTACERSPSLPILSYGQAAHTQCDSLGRQIVRIDAVTNPIAIQGVADAAGTKQIFDPCQSHSKVYGTQSITANTQIVTGVSANKIYFCSWNDLSASAENYAVVEGTGSVCATGIASFPGLSGGTTAATGWNVAANQGRTYGNGSASIAGAATAGDSVCVLISGSTQLNIGYSYVIVP